MSGAEIIVTGNAWVGSGFGSIETALRHGFERAENEILLTAYSISTAGDLVFPLLSAALARGLEVRAVINRLNAQPADVQMRLHNLNRTYKHLKLFDYDPGDQPTDLHAKVVVFDRITAIVGSSNLSQRGLTSNHEISALMKGEVATRVAAAVDRIFTDPACQPVL